MENKRFAIHFGIRDSLETGRKELPMCQTFYWTARLFQDGQVVHSKYFATQAERDAFVQANPGWVKRGKICTENLQKHLQEEVNP